MQFPANSAFPVYLETPIGSPWLYVGPNDSPIHRGDREDTGDEEARPDELGSGPAIPTADPTSLGGVTSPRHPPNEDADVEQEQRDDDDMEILLPTDGRLGLTNI
jgi:hypothetical protein